MDLSGSMDAIEPIVTNETVYLAVTTSNSPTEGDGYIGAYDRATGDQLWETNRFPRPKTPTVYDGTLYVATRVPEYPGSNEGGLYAIDAKTGEIEWKRTNRLKWLMPVVEDDRLYTATADGAYALDTESGETIWKRANVGGLSDGLGGSLSYADGTVFGSDGTALDATDGSVSWQAPEEKRTFGNHTVSNGRIFYIRSDYIQGDDSRVVVEARSAATGDIDWTYSSSGHNRWDGRLAVAKNYVLIPHSNATEAGIAALDVRSGAVKWSTDLYGDFFSNPTVADETVYLGGRYLPEDDPRKGFAVVYAVALRSGNIRWVYRLDSSNLKTTSENPSAAGTPVVSDGNLYTATYPAGSTLRYQYLEYSNFFALKSWNE
ncbi:MULTISPECIES: PQQ-binding-like beta-propeller repeat protein [unclassified Haladaptatus]|uniref:PQQ-binding-like beta-propeller repeat protein n=1 Tax=unclassified Haladaptatus TaxID=2622732 RepID=UPI00209BE9A4|nr:MULTISPECIES: PQQ-binding-like beta-propeller repeat protein [unclassified Haladaptatus]MCO8244863.1 PQQ-like beta-propeller repeat protein [Haladaptatus sp. AB643]MCO8255624.1 PQQ-like beta-propeller repeat protein [Haladaptatus sp. AB618]